MTNFHGWDDKQVSHIWDLMVGMATVVGISMAIAVAFLFRHLPWDLLGDLVTDLSGHLYGNLHRHLNRDILAALPWDLFWHLMALLHRHILAFLVVTIPIALLLVGGLAGLLVDRLVMGGALLLVAGLVLGLVVSLVGGLVDGVALVLILGLVDGLVGGVALGVRLVAVSMTVTVATVVGMRGCGAEANDCKNDDGG